MKKLHFTTHDQEMVADARIVSDGLDTFNHTVAPLHEVQPLSCFARDSDDSVVGGAVGRTWGKCCELTELWVHDEHRGSGIGKQLLEQFESQARARGCSVFYLTTFSFQARGLYEQLGYEVKAEVKGFSGDIAKYTMVRIEA